MSETHPQLFSPGRIGTLELRNRLLMTPMGTNQERSDGHLGDGILDYYEARARGGVGMVIAGVAAICWPNGAANPNQAAISDERFLPDWREFARRCTTHGARSAVQVQHAGKVAVEDIAAGRPLWVPSALAPKAGDLYDALTPEERNQATAALRAPGAKFSYQVMGSEEIAAVITAFADAAELAQRAGVDGVELHAGHGYLLSAFLSPASNRRDDAYGGSLENRARLLLETIAAVRARVGPDYPLWCRLDATEFRVEGGISLEDACRTAELAAAAGLDAIHVSAYADPTSSAGFTDAPLVHEPGRYLPFAAAVKKRVKVPVIAVGRIDPDTAEAALREGQADFVAMGRKLLADPDLPRKLAAGEQQQVRPCVYTYQCVGNVFLRQASRCTMNPEMGREAELSLVAASAPRRIAVVGGGPCGLEAARVAAARGHRVVLYEREAELGGRARLGARLDPEMARYLAYAADAVTRAGVELRLGASPDPETLAAEADAVVVATGATRDATLSGSGPALLEVEQLASLLDAPEPPAAVVVVGSDVIGAKAAEALATAGWQVTLLEGDAFAPEMGVPRRWRALDLLSRAGVVRVAKAHPLGLEPAGVRYADEDGEAVAPGRVVVWAAGLAANPALADALRGQGVDVHPVGDCQGPRYLQAGLLEAARLGRAL